MKTNGNNSNSGVIIGVIALVIVLATAVVLVNPGGIIPASLTQGQQQASTPFGNQETGPQLYKGPVLFKTSGYDVLESGTVYTDADYTANYFRKNPDSSYTPIGTGTDVTDGSNPTSARFNLGLNDNKIFMTIMPQDGGSSDLLFTSPAAIMAQNPQILSFDFFNIDGDSDMEWVFEIDATNVGEFGRETEVPEIHNTILLYDDITTMTTTTGGVLASVGTGIQTNRLKYSLEFSEDASVDPQVEYRWTFNSTTTTLWNTANSYADIPGIGKKFLSQMDESQTSTTTIYKYKPATSDGTTSSLEAANYVTVGGSDDTSVDIPLVLETNFATDDGLQITFQVTSMTPSQGFTTSSDCTKLTNAAGSTNC